MDKFMNLKIQFNIFSDGNRTGGSLRQFVFAFEVDVLNS